MWVLVAHGGEWGVSVGEHEGRLATLHTSMKIIEILMKAVKPLSVKEISDIAGLRLRTAYRYLSFLDMALHPRLLSSEKTPKTYWLDK